MKRESWKKVWIGEVQSYAIHVTITVVAVIVTIASVGKVLQMLFGG